MKQQEMIITTISNEYVPNWTEQDGLRELLQEALDAEARFGCKIKLRYDPVKNRGIIEDNGPGLSRADIALGVSGKRDNAKLKGQFGEGWKLAALVLTRLGAIVRIDTVGFSLEARIIEHPLLGVEVLAFEMTRNKRQVGTRFSVTGINKKDWEGAKGRFLRFNRDLVTPGRKTRDPEQDIFLPGGRIFVNGCLASVQDNLLFSYNFTGESGKEAQNRDRSIVDGAFLRQAVNQALRNVNNKAVITRYITECIATNNRCGYLEGDAFYGSPDAERKWKTALRQVLGPKICISYTPNADLEAENAGYRVLSVNSAIQSVLVSLGVQHSDDVLKSRRRTRAKKIELNPYQRDLLRWAKRLLAKWVGRPNVTRVKVVDNCDLIDANNARSENGGLYDPSRNIVYIEANALHDPAKLFDTLLHEVMHRITGASDATRSYETGCIELAGRIIRGTSRIKPPNPADYK